MILVTIDDFKKGFFALALAGDDETILQNVIDQNEAISIKRILGDELGKKFIDDVTGEDSDSSAIEARFQKILDEWTAQGDTSMIVYCEPPILESMGIKFVLLSIIFYKYVTLTASKHSQSGVVIPQAETAGVFSTEGQARFAEQKYNNALGTIEAIQWLCRWDEPETYPEYKGLRFKPLYSALL